MSDSSSNVQINSIVSYKKKLLGSSKATIKSKFTASQTLINNSAKIKTPAAPYNAFINPLIYEVDETEKIDFPDTAYNAIYPFNHVYESESGHLIEIDDTPEAERLHWYHRAGTFTEFTFGGSRVENTQGHNFHSITGNLEEIISGKEKRSISNDSFSTYSKNKFQDIGNDYVLTTKGDLLLGSSGGFLSIKGNNVVIDASQTLYMEATNIIRSQKSSRDVFRGSYTQEIFGGLNSKAETISFDMVKYQDVLTLAATTVKIPTKPLILGAYARALSERGEDGGTQSSIAATEASTSIAQAIMMDSGNVKFESDWFIGNIH